MDQSLMDQIVQEVQGNDLFRGGALLGIIGSLLFYLKHIPIHLAGRIDRLARYRTTIDNASSGRLLQAFGMWYGINYPDKLRNTMAVFERTEDISVHQYKIEYFHKTDVTWIWNRIFPIVINKQRSRLEHAMYHDNLYEDIYEISSFFGKRRIIKLLEEVTAWYNNYLIENSGGVTVYTGTTNYEKRIISYKKFDRIYHQCADVIREDVESYEGRAAFYKSMGIRNKRNYFFWGDAGTGKTSLAIAIAAHTTRGIYILNLAALGNDKELNDFINNMERHSLILLEDVHTWFESDNTKVSLSALLNMLDGVASPEDVIIVATANRLSAIDDAFLRSGRMDVVMEIGKSDPEYVSRFVSDYYGVPFTINKSLTIAEVQEACLRTKDIVNLHL